MEIQSHYTKTMYQKDIAQWEAFHEGNVYDDLKAQKIHDRIVLRKVK